MQGLGPARVGIAPARAHPARLKRLEIAARGDFAVTLLPGQPDLDIVGLCGGRARISGTKRNHPVGEPETLKDDLGVADEFFERRPGVLGPDDVDEFDLLELVLAEHAASVLAVGTGLRAKTRRVRGQLDRQPVGLDDRLAHEVGQRHLGGRDQEIPAVACDREQIFLELRQLARAEQRVLVDEIRHVSLGVAVLLRMHVEHELDQRAVKPGDSAVQNDESAAGELRSRLEIEHAERPAEVGVVPGLELELARLAPAPNLDVRRLIRAVRNVGTEQIRQPLHDLVERAGNGVKVGFGFRERVAECTDLLPQSFDVFARGPGRADRFRARVALPAQRLNLVLQALRSDSSSRNRSQSSTKPRRARFLATASRSFLRSLGSSMNRMVIAGRVNGERRSRQQAALDPLAPAPEQPERRTQSNEYPGGVYGNIHQIEASRRHADLQDIEHDSKRHEEERDQAVAPAFAETRKPHHQDEIGAAVSRLFRRRAGFRDRSLVFSARHVPLAVK